MNKADLKIDWATYQAAKYACEKWHYSGGMPVAKIVKIGVWERQRFIGVVLFSKGTCGHLFDRFGLDKKSGCELTRVALDRHDVPVTKIIAIAIGFLKRQSPGLRLIVSFAAKSEGHHGGIYQGGNWLYDGETSFKQEYLLRGKRLTDRTVSSWVQKGKIRRSELTKASSDTKHRYLMPLDAKMREQIAPLAKPYPKRVKKAISGDQSEGGGAVPTHTLHLNGTAASQ